MKGRFNALDRDNPSLVSGTWTAQAISKPTEQLPAEHQSENLLDGLWTSELIVTKWFVPKDTLPQFSSGSLSHSFKIENGRCILDNSSYEDDKLTVEGNKIVIKDYSYEQYSTKLHTFTGVISSDMKSIEGNFSWQIKAENETKYDTWLEAQWLAVKEQTAVNEQPIVNNNEEDNQDNNNIVVENPFVPQPISDEDANTATTTSGILAGLAALISSFSGLLPKGFLPQLSVPITPPPPFAEQPTYPEQPGFNQSVIPPSPNTPPSSPPRPTIGTRRADGKILTKNHGWQHEEFPGIQANSLKNTINSLENDIQRHTQNGDRLRTEIAKDELKRSQRELKKWSEDATAIRKIQSGETEDFYQNQAKHWDTRADNLETAANAANTISFASDIGLAIATGGVSSVYTGAKSIGTMKTALKTFNVLITAKELAGAGANIYDGYLQGKNMAVVITKEAVNKGISMGVGKIFDAGKGTYDFKKYGFNKSSDSLKILVASAESSAGNVAQNIAEESGLTGKITGVVDKADNHFKGSAQNLNNIAKRGK